MSTPVREDAGRRLTIGAVCAALRLEHPDISISKIRYLEDQGLLTPKRTQGGYRLFSQDDVDRLRTILRLQRDEFLPLRVIRDELERVTQGARERPSTRRRTPATVGRARRSTSSRARRAPTRSSSAASRSSACSRRSTGAISPRIRRSSRPAPSWRASVSGHAICAPCTPRSSARRA